MFYRQLSGRLANLSFGNGEFLQLVRTSAKRGLGISVFCCGKPQTDGKDCSGIPCLTDSAYMTGTSPQIQNLQNAIQFAKQSHQVNAQNLANLNTKNYKARELSFDRFLEQVESGDVSSDGLELQLMQGLQVREDGNNVDMDHELAELKKNSLAYQTLTQLLGSKMSIMKRAISS